MRTIIIVLCIESRDFLHRPEDNLNAQFQWEWNVGTTFFKNPQTAHNNWSGSAVCQQIDWTWECTSRGTHSAMGGRVPVAVPWSGGFDFKTFNNWSSVIQCNIFLALPPLSWIEECQSQAQRLYLADMHAKHTVRSSQKEQPTTWDTATELCLKRPFSSTFLVQTNEIKRPAALALLLPRPLRQLLLLLLLLLIICTTHYSPLSVQSTLPLHWLPTSPSIQPASQPSRPPINSKRIGPRTI